MSPILSVAKAPNGAVSLSSGLVWISHVVGIARRTRSAVAYRVGGGDSRLALRRDGRGQRRAGAGRHYAGDGWRRFARPPAFGRFARQKRSRWEPDYLPQGEPRPGDSWNDFTVNKDFGCVGQSAGDDVPEHKPVFRGGRGHLVLNKKTACISELLCVAGPAGDRLRKDQKSCCQRCFSHGTINSIMPPRKH